jgi:Icc-related predicted phosphoesterase
MRLLLSADIHGNQDAFFWLAHTARDLAVPIVLAGDLLGCPEGFETPEQAQELDAAQMFATLTQAEVQVFYIWGNDDFIEASPPSGRIKFIHGCRIELGPWNLVGYQYSLPFVGGPHEREETSIAADLARLAPLVDSQTVLVTHSPAYGVLDLGILNMNAGSPAILELVQRRGVRAHVHGHIHRCAGSQGCHFNVAASAQSRAVLLDLATLESEVLRGPEAAA